jgi:uncharacterized protein (DUF1330 family)
MPAAYVIVDMQVSNMEQYKQYMAAAPASIHAAGGEYLVRGGQLEARDVPRSACQTHGRHGPFPYGFG